ncbi:MAG: protein adenylyltransferase SelO family protein, partial [Myxococcota bacterium]
MEFSNTYANLDEVFYEKTRPVPVQDPQVLLWNSSLAEELLISDTLQNDRAALAQAFSGNQLLPGSDPLAMAYAGHQFGHFVPQLGDGRAHLLGEVLDRSGQRRDIQLKGSGRSMFSRGGDGRCAIGPAVREFIMSEAMHALRVPTTRCLAVVTT